MKSEVMDLVERNMRRLASTIAAGFGAEAKVSFRAIAPPVVNHSAETVALGNAAVGVAGEANVDRAAPPVMGSEDFAYMMERVPGAHISIGNGDTAGVHNHRYDFNDEAIPFGSALFAAIVKEKLPKGASD
jgi:hippurate hydrolase